jgi:hypothetical protein
MVTILINNYVVLYHKMDTVACTGDVESLSVCAISTSIIQHSILSKLRMAAKSDTGKWTEDRPIQAL